MHCKSAVFALQVGGAGMAVSVATPFFGGGGFPTAAADTRSPRTMKTGLAEFLLSLLVDGGGAVGSFARKGLDALRALLGGVSGRLGPLLKRALALVASKLSTGTRAARSKIDGALASLKRRVEAVQRGEAPEAEPEPEAEAEPVQEAAAASSCAASASSSSCAASASSSSCATSPAPASTTAAASVAETSTDDGTPRVPLSTLLPLLGRSLVRALDRSRGMRSGRASPLVLGAT